MAAPAAAGVASAASSGASSAAGTAAIGGAVSGGMSILSSLMNNLFNRKNIQEQNAYNEALMREAWARDDTAYTRMVQDLENAGLSKWLATGKSAMISDPVRMEAVKDDFGGFADAGRHALEAYNASIQTKIAQETHEKEMSLWTAQKDLLEAQADEAKASAELKRHDTDIWLSRDDTASTDPVGFRVLAEAIKSLKGERSSLNIGNLGNENVGGEKIVQGLENGAEIPLSAVRTYVVNNFGEPFADFLGEEGLKDIQASLYKDANKKAKKAGKKEPYPGY